MIGDARPSLGPDAGSILGMPRALLVKAGPHFAVPVLGTIAATIMAGGLGLGALPMSGMYAAHTGQDASAVMGDLMSAVVLANVFCIIFAGLLNGLGKNRPALFAGFNGNGDLIRVKGDRRDLSMPKKAAHSTHITLGKGLLFAAVIFVVGELVGAHLTFLHPYAWAIIMVILKLTGWLPKDLEESATDWGDLINAVPVPALLVGVSLAYIKIDEVLVSLADPAFIILTFLCVLVAGLSSGIIGWLVKFNFVEVAIVPGLVMADIGGSGDVSVLNASERMHLMPFAAITNRIGCTLVLFLTSLMVPMLAL